jgi:hypothetical protein
VKHELKSHPQFFKASWRGFKPFEIRKNDRKFEPMDEVVLQEWDPDAQDSDTFEKKGAYTGREITGFINYVSHYQQQEGYVVFSFEETGRSEE